MTSKTPFFQRPSVITGAVLLLHAGGLWALQSGLITRTLEMVIPVEVLSQIIEPPKPEITPPPKPEPLKPQPVQEKVVKQPNLPPPPQPLAINDPTPAPNAPVVAAAPPAPLPPIAAPVAASPAPVAAAAPAAPAPAPAPAPVAKVELPRSDADYLNNPAPSYPSLSKRTGEQGRVMLRVLVREDGGVERVELRKGSGYERLDAAAIAAVQRWRFKPGTRGGTAEAMWANVPIDFNLD